jgi:hypothetical protein
MSNESKVNLTTEAIIALTEFRTAKKKAKEAEQEMRNAEKILRDFLGEATVGMSDGMPVVRIVASTNSHLNKNGLAEKHPELYKEYLVTTPYTYVRAL